MAEQVQNEKGGISVETQHIFPIIKRWLYSDKEIFFAKSFPMHLMRLPSSTA